MSSLTQSFVLSVTESVSRATLSGNSDIPSNPNKCQYEKCGRELRTPFNTHNARQKRFCSPSCRVLQYYINHPEKLAIRRQADRDKDKAKSELVAK